MSAVPADPVQKALNGFQAAQETARRHQDEVIGADVDPQRCFGDFLVTVAKARSGSTAARRRIEGVYKTQEIHKTAMVEASGVGGGYLVPTEFQEKMMRDVSDIAVVRPRALVTTQDSWAMQVPMPDAGAAQATSTAPFYGGWLATYPVEGAAITENEPTFRQVEITAWWLGGYVVGSNNWLNDSRGLEAWLRRMFAAGLAWYEDLAIIAGNGVGKPQSLATNPATVVVGRQTTVTFTATDSQNMLQAHHTLTTTNWTDDEKAGGSNVWIVNRTLANTVPGFTGWFPNGPLQLHGAPIAFTTKQPKAGVQGDVILADLSFYVISDRQQTTVDFSPYDAGVYQKNQSSWRVFERIGGASLLNAPITMTDGSGSTISPFVALSTK